MSAGWGASCELVSRLSGTVMTPAKRLLLFVKSTVAMLIVATVTAAIAVIVAAVVIVRCTIQRDGTITDVQIERPSGYAALDINARRAVIDTRQLPPLPAAYANSTLTVHPSFEYTR